MNRKQAKHLSSFSKEELERMGYWWEADYYEELIYFAQRGVLEYQDPETGEWKPIKKEPLFCGMVRYRIPQH